MMPQPTANGQITPSVATSVAVPPTRKSSEDLTSSPTRNSRNMVPSVESASRNVVGAIQPNTLGPINTPASISPESPGWPSRSNNSAISLAAPNTTSMANGIFQPSPSVESTSAGESNMWTSTD